MSDDFSGKLHRLGTSFKEAKLLFRAGGTEHVTEMGMLRLVWKKCELQFNFEERFGTANSQNREEGKKSCI